MQVECTSLEVISLKVKKSFVGAAVSLTFLINFPQVSADDVEVFGGEFDENSSEVVPFQDENEDLGSTLVFNDPEKSTTENPPANENPQHNPPAEETPPVKENPPPPNETTPPTTENPSAALPVTETPRTEIPVTLQPVVIEPTPQRARRERILPPSRVQENVRENEKRKSMKTQKPRFIKLMIDDDYTYYLDKQSVSWKRIPYSASEYMLDVWVRMIERTPNDSDLPEDLSEYINEDFNGEIEVAKERGILFAPEDVEVLKHRKYFLEHYYLRPKTKQIQFLCELEVVGHPQNTVSEREYNYKNWENLIPGSIESTIYHMILKEVGKSGSSERGHMSFADYLEEYARISIR